LLTIHRPDSGTVTGEAGSTRRLITYAGRKPIPKTRIRSAPSRA